MTSSETIETIQALVEQLNAGNLEAMHAALSPNFFAYHPAAGEPRQNDTFLEFTRDFKAAFSDLHLTLSDLVEDGDLVRGTMTLEGTHDGPFWGAPSSGNPASFSCPVTLRKEAGGWAVSLENIAPPQLIGVLRQMDLVPAPEDMDKPPKYPIAFPEMMMRLLFTGQVADKACSHLDMIKVTDPERFTCDDCEEGEIYPTVRLCLTCGHLGCCDTSKNKHAHKHYEETGHPLMRSIRLDEGWIWCYEDNAFFSKRTLEKYSS